MKEIYKKINNSPRICYNSLDITNYNNKNLKNIE